MIKHKKLLGAIGAATVALALGGVALLGVETHQSSVYTTDGPQFANLGELTRDAQVVVRARVVGDGRSYTTAYDPAKTVVDPLPQGGPRARSGGPPAAIDPVERPADEGVVKTDTAIEVLEVIRGDAVQPGDRLTLVQLGGVDTHGTEVMAEHDPLVKKGEEEVLFLRKDPRSDKFFTAGGGQGRFKVTGRGAVEAVDDEAPVGKANHGKSVNALKAEIKAAR